MLLLEIGEKDLAAQSPVCICRITMMDKVITVRFANFSLAGLSLAVDRNRKSSRKVLSSKPGPTWSSAHLAHFLLPNEISCSEDVLIWPIPPLLHLPPNPWPTSEKSGPFELIQLVQDFLAENFYPKQKCRNPFLPSFPRTCLPFPDKKNNKQKKKTRLSRS